ncbi:hypothetical protein ACSFA8_11000 [Variovorax sp. RT4R15]|uniref:hypothetical protein n=1 Tax=Variovorax sp. RT4R15 TaxID=3443737 RepID=UPI003F45AB01
MPRFNLTRWQATPTLPVWQTTVVFTLLTTRSHDQYNTTDGHERRADKFKLVAASSRAPIRLRERVGVCASISADVPPTTHR